MAWAGKRLCLEDRCFWVFCSGCGKVWCTNHADKPAHFDRWECRWNPRKSMNKEEVIDKMVFLRQHGLLGGPVMRSQYSLERCCHAYDVYQL